MDNLVLFNKREARRIALRQFCLYGFPWTWPARAHRGDILQLLDDLWQTVQKGSGPQGGGRAPSRQEQEIYEYSCDSCHVVYCIWKKTV